MYMVEEGGGYVLVPRLFTPATWVYSDLYVCTVLIWGRIFLYIYTYIHIFLYIYMVEEGGDKCWYLACLLLRPGYTVICMYVQY